jgi:uncharacterized protein involved in response to NO
MALSNKLFVGREVVMRDTSSALPSVEVIRQEPFGRVVSLLKVYLLLGVGAGFLLVLVRLVAYVLSFPLNVWWLALNQAYDHLQLYGWASLFVIGIVLHFLPRLRGVPLVAPWLLPWIVWSQVAALLLRVLSQPLLVITGKSFWRILLVLSGVFECVAFGTAALLFALIIWRGTRLVVRVQYHQAGQKRKAWSVDALRAFLYAGRPKRSIELGLGGAFVSMALAAMVNMGNVVQAAAGTGLVLGQGDGLNVVLGLFGFLVPVALMLSAHSLPAYVERRGFPHQVFWPLSAVYFVGLAFTFIGMSWTSTFPWLSIMSGFGMILLAIVLLTFMAVFLSAMHLRERLRLRVPQDITRSGVDVRTTAGPFVWLITSSYLWAVLGALLLGVNGVASMLGRPPFLAPDAMHYSFALGFIALLLAGVSVRMFPDFSGLKIAGPAWVTGLFWIGNGAAVLHVGPLLFLPLLVAWGNMGLTAYAVLFDFADLFGLALAICLALSLWPALRDSNLILDKDF